jgi:hypothetical protein
MKPVTKREKKNKKTVEIYLLNEFQSSKKHNKYFKILAARQTQLC